MPRRPPIANLERLTDAMSPLWRAALEDAIAVLQLDPERWQEQCPSLVSVVQQVTTLQLAARIAGERGIGADVALEEAAARLGISADTIRSRHRRGRVLKAPAAAEDAA